MFKKFFVSNRKLTAWLLLTAIIFQLLLPLSLKASAETDTGFISSGMREFKNSFNGIGSPSWLLQKFGVQVGYHLIECAMEGEKPDLIKVAKSMATADYLARTTGAIIGAAAGSFFIPVVSCVPVFGGFLADFVPTLGHYFGAELAGSGLAGIKNGGFSFKSFFKKLDWTSMIAGSLGWTAGSLLCSAIFPPIGGIVGGMLGDVIAGKLLEKFRKWRNDSEPPSHPTSLGGPIKTRVPAAKASLAPKLMNSGNSLVEGSISPSDREKIINLTQRYDTLYQEYQKKFLSSKKEELQTIAREMNRLKLQIEGLRKAR